MFPLSIGVPTYNRAEEITTLLDSIPSCKDIQVVIVDDGSTDNTKEIIEHYSQKYSIKYLYQANQGRATALKKAILAVDGKYCMLMDSDDAFMPQGVHEILKNINELEHIDTSKNINSLLFGVQLVKGDIVTLNTPPAVISNFVKIRADLNVKHDLKEIVRTDILKNCIYDIPTNCRRVPTSLLWATVAEHTSCLCIDKVVASKEYLPGGMTDQILKLKTRDSQPMVELYNKLSQSKTYTSTLYRWRCRLLWGRHSLHYGNITSLNWWKLLVLPFAFVIFQIDLYKLGKGRREEN